MVHVPADAVEVAEVFGEVARALTAQGDVPQTLEKIVHLAVENLDACEHAGISFVEGRTITSSAASGAVPRIVDAIQTETNEGPCLDAIREHAVFETDDLRTEVRWPKFSARANEETGIVSILSLRLFVEEDTMGSLNLYSAQPNAFDDSDAAMASVFAVHAAVAMQSAQREAGLARKAASRDVIGQAKGILMARSNVDEDVAFEMLKRASQRMNVKLRDLAERIARGEPVEQEGTASPGRARGGT